MNKSELTPKVRNLFDSVLLNDGYRYLKSYEKYQKKLKDLRLWFYPEVTYWPSSSYCTVCPRLSVHVDAIEDILSSHKNIKLDRHFPTLTILSSNLNGAKSWAVTNDQDLFQQSDEILEVINSICLPVLESWSSAKQVAITALHNDKMFFHSELHRLCVLFAYVAAFNDSDILPQVVQSVDLDSISRSRNQQDPYYRGILASMRSDVPEIGEVGIDL